MSDFVDIRPQKTPDQILANSLAVWEQGIKLNDSFIRDAVGAYLHDTASERRWSRLVLRHTLVLARTAITTRQSVLSDVAAVLSAAPASTQDAFERLRERDTLALSRIEQINSLASTPSDASLQSLFPDAKQGDSPSDVQHVTEDGIRRHFDGDIDEIWLTLALNQQDQLLSHTYFEITGALQEHDPIPRLAAATTFMRPLVTAASAFEEGTVRRLQDPQSDTATHLRARIDLFCQDAKSVYDALRALTARPSSEDTARAVSRMKSRYRGRVL